MKRIVCDTQIWYHLFNGIIEKPKNFSLTGTFLSIEELAITTNQETDLENVRNVIRTAMSVSDVFLGIPPFHYVAAFDHPYISRKDYPIIEGFLEYTQLIANNNESEEILQKVIPYRTNRKNLYSQLAEDINELVKTAKKSKIKKSEYWKLVTIPDNRILVGRWIEQSTGFQLSVEFDWGQIELFEKVMEYWFKELAINKTLWVKPNDLVDFFNLLYVGPDDLYWCRDRAWNRRIKDAGMSKYLYEIF